MSNTIITKFIAVALTTAAISTVAATGNAVAGEGGRYWHRGYGHGFGYGRYYGGYGHGDFYRGYGDCYRFRFHHRYWGCEGY